MVQLSHLYMTTGKTIALIIQTFVGKMMSLFSNMLSEFVKGFPDGTVVKNPLDEAGDTRDSSLISGWEDPLV